MAGKSRLLDVVLGAVGVALFSPVVAAAAIAPLGE